MPQTLGEWLVERAGTIEDPDAPSKRREVADPPELAQCIDALLDTAAARSELADLPRRLDSARATLESETLVAGDLLTATKAVAEGFENFLQLVALVKYADRPELLEGDEVHEGFMHSALGSLLLGTPTARRTASEEAKRQIPKAAIVRFAFGSRELAPRLYERVRQARNEVHAARHVDAYELLRDARHTVAAYVLAVDENRQTLARALAEHRAYLERAASSGRAQLPFIVEPVLAIDHASGTTTLRLGGFVEKLATEPIRLSITGDPGAGKTTLIRAIVGLLAERRLAAPFRRMPLPVYVQASRYSNDQPFADLVAGELGIDASTLEREWQKDWVALFLDGVNEIPARLLREALLDVDRLRTRFPSWSVVVTTRSHRLPRGLGFESAQLLPFDDDQMREYLRQALGGDGPAAAFGEQLDAAPRLRQLCRTPLLLHMLVDVSGGTLRVPDNRGQLLHEFMSRFLEREREAFSPIEPVTVQTVLSHLAFAMRERKVVALPQREVYRLVGASIAGLQSGVGTVDVVAAAIGAHLLQPAGADNLAFFHELVQEYFAALRVVDLFESARTLPAALGSDAWWDEVAVLAYGLSREDPQLLKAIQGASVTLSARSVMDAQVPDDERVASVVREASAELGRGAPLEALEALGIVWNEAARRSVVAALRTSTELADFLLRLTDDPVTAAIDILGESDDSEAARAVLSVLENRKVSDDGARRLGETIASRAEKWAEKRWSPMSPNDAERLCRHARFTSEASRTATTAFERVFNGAPRLLPLLIETIRHRTDESAARVPGHATDWRVAAGRLLLSGNLLAVSARLPLASPEDLDWFEPFLPVFREIAAAVPAAAAIVTWFETNRNSADGTVVHAKHAPESTGGDRSEGETEVELPRRPSRSAPRAEEEAVPDEVQWASLDVRRRGAFLNRQLGRLDIAEVVRGWPEHLVSALPQHLNARIRRAHLELPDEVWEFAGIANRGADAAGQHVLTLAERGDEEAAVRLARQWNVPVPTLAPVPVTQLRASQVAGRIQSGAITVPEAEEWLLQHARSEPIEEILSYAHRLRKHLSGAASVVIAELLESGNEVAAGQMIAAFHLDEDFTHDLPRLVPTLIASGKTGLAERFSARRAPPVSELNRAAIQQLEHAVSEGRIRKAIEMVRRGGFGYLENDLRRLIGDRVEQLGLERDAVGLEQLLREPELRWFVDASRLYRALDLAGVLLKGEVKAKRRGMALVGLLATADRVSLDRRLAPLVFDGLGLGGSVFVMVRVDEAELHACRVQADSHPDPSVTSARSLAGVQEPAASVNSPNPSEGAEASPDPQALEKLSQRWGARIRR